MPSCRISNYITGFVDANGKFQNTLTRDEEFKYLWRPSSLFEVSATNIRILSVIKNNLKCGRIYLRDNIFLYIYEVDKIDSIVEKIIPFFDRYNFISTDKRLEFQTFKEIAYLIKDKQYENKLGIRKIVDIKKRSSNEDSFILKIEEDIKERILRDHTLE